MSSRLLFVFFIIFFLSEKSISAVVLSDSTISVEDLEGDKIVVQKKGPNPTIAGLLSAVIPGAGQIYSKRYYHAIGIYVLGYIGYYYRKQFDEVFQLYHSAYLLRADRDKFTIDVFDPRIENRKYPIQTEDGLLSLSDSRRRSRDLITAGMIVFYVANIIDAIVGAHLKGFDIGDNKDFKKSKQSAKIQALPTYLPHLNTTGLAVLITF